MKKLIIAILLLTSISGYSQTFNFALGQLKDVSVSSPTINYVLTWNGSLWVAAAPAGGGTWGSITGTLSDQTDLQTALDLKAPLASPTFTGTVTIPTPFTLGAVSVLPTGTELNFVDGVTSGIQAQIDAKAPTASPTFTGTITTPLTASRAVVTGASSELAVSATTAIEIGYVNGVTSAIQTQINTKAMFTLPFHTAAGNPTDGTTYYFGNFALGFTTNAIQYETTIDRACILESVNIDSYSVTAGTGEDWSFYVRVNNTTDYLIATVSATTNNRVWGNTALNISLNAGDKIVLKTICPTWATNPGTVVIGGYAVFK